MGFHEADSDFLAINRELAKRFYAPARSYPTATALLSQDAPASHVYFVMQGAV